MTERRMEAMSHVKKVLKRFRTEHLLIVQDGVSLIFKVYVIPKFYIKLSDEKLYKESVLKKVYANENGEIIIYNLHEIVSYDVREYYDEAAEGFIKKIKELSGYDVHLEIY